MPGTPDASRASPSLFEKASRILNVPKSPKPEEKKAQYDVAPKDVSVLERISHKAQRRELRVRKPHEVCVCMCVFV